MLLIKHIFDRRARILDRLLGKRLAFYHVPKCAGTSVSRSLRTRYFLSQHSVGAPLTFSTSKRVLNDNTQALRSFRMALFDYLIEKDYYFVGGHVPLCRPTFDKFRAGRSFITVLREPVARFISEFTYNYKTGTYSSVEVSLDDFLRTHEAVQYGSRYVEYFCGEKDFTRPDERLADQAKGNLELFGVVGSVEDMKTFRENIKHELGVSVRFGRENTSSSRARGLAEEIDQDALGKIRDICAYDIEIYRHVIGETSH